MSTDDLARHFPVGDVSRPGNPLKPLTGRRTREPATGTRGATLIAISRRLRPRDYSIASLLHQHSVLTTDQLTAVLFDNPTTCRHRLGHLRSLGFVEGFVHRTALDAPTTTCWIPGLLSAPLAALAAGENPPTLRAVRERQDRIYASPVLDHAIDTNEFFVQLLVHARADPQTSLLRWWSERATAAAFGQRVHPDGHGFWADGNRRIGFFLELDRGTESLDRLVGKLRSYRRLLAEGGPAYPVLFALPNRAREQNLHRRLAEKLDANLVVATTSRDIGHDPAGPVWRLAGTDARRRALADLPGSQGQPGPLNPAAPTAADHPLPHLASRPPRATPPPHTPAQAAQQPDAASNRHAATANADTPDQPD